MADQAPESALTRPVLQRIVAICDGYRPARERPTDLSDREEYIDDLAYRHRLVCDPRASVVAKVGASTLA
jgi:hypothetical protein